ncbi:hypothetical protein KCU65_g5684, partial [Aureobasidium melanogenum]
MNGNQPAPDLKEQYRNAVLNLPIDNPTAYLREIKRLQSLMLDMEFEQLDHSQEPEKVRKDFNEVKKNTRELRLSPACLRAVQASENSAGGESAPEQSAVEELAVKESTSGEPAVDKSIALTEEPSAKEPANTETTAKKNKKKKKKKPASKNGPVSEQAANHSEEMDSDTEAKALRMRITKNYLDTIRPKNSTDANSGEYRMELIQNVANELLNVKCMVLNFMDTSDSFNAKAMEEMEKLGQRLINLEDGNKDLMAVINELDKVRMRGLKCKNEVKELKDELDDVKLEYEFTKNEVVGVKLELEDTKVKLASVLLVSLNINKDLAEAKKELNVTRQELDVTRQELDVTRRELDATKKELADVKMEFTDTKQELIQFKWEFEDTKTELEEVKEKSQDIEKKMDEMYAWFNKQKEVPLSHFH